MSTTGKLRSAAPQEVDESRQGSVSKPAPPTSMDALPASKPEATDYQQTIKEHIPGIDKVEGEPCGQVMQPNDPEKRGLAGEGGVEGTMGMQT